jgi:hypothetical protein
MVCVWNQNQQQKFFLKILLRGEHLSEKHNENIDDCGRPLCCTNAKVSVLACGIQTAAGSFVFKPKNVS